ncbi:MAG: DUF4258 domain-containing protein [Kordiimonadaceae bacterium]|nr:DUF4258 domain-containing protein [Kordiimonadaceae bacterium]
MAAPQFQNEGTRLRKLMRERILKMRFRFHAKGRMKEYNISMPDVVTVLKRGAVIDVECEANGDEKWTAQGRLASDGRIVHIVVKADENEISIAVVTVIDKTNKKHR